MLSCCDTLGRGSLRSSCGIKMRAGLRLCLMSNTSKNSSIPLIQVAKHTRARIVLWQSVHGCSALPEPLQEPPARANPVMRYPSAAGFFLHGLASFKGVDPGRLPPADNALRGIRFRTFQACPKDVGGPLQAYSVSSTAISPPQGLTERDHDAPSLAKSSPGGSAGHRFRSKHLYWPESA